ncbi:MAG: DUF4339 domain-containing protein [Planctomycetia bacterium]|nr:DUF4339 domain-containing protein [Planctomycetia bacterium]
MEYYVKIRGKQHGPYSAAVLRDMTCQGRVGRSTPTSLNGSDWGVASDFEEIFPKREVATTSSNAFASESSMSSGGSPANDLSTVREWFISNDGETGTGPYTSREIGQGFVSGHYNRRSLVWREGGNPVYLEDSVEFGPLFAGAASTARPAESATIPRSFSASSQPAASVSGQASADPFSLPASASSFVSNEVNASQIVTQLYQIEQDSKSWVFIVGLAQSLALVVALILFFFLLFYKPATPVVDGVPSPVAFYSADQESGKYAAAQQSVEEDAAETNSEESPLDAALFDEPVDVSEPADLSESLDLSDMTNIPEASGLSMRPVILVGMFLSVLLYLWFIVIVVRHWQYYAALHAASASRTEQLMLLCRRRMAALWHAWGIFSVGQLATGGILFLLWVICLVW